MRILMALDYYRPKALMSERQTHPGTSRVANAPYLQPVFGGANFVYRVAGGP